MMLDHKMTLFSSALNQRSGNTEVKGRSSGSLDNNGSEAKQLYLMLVWDQV